MASAYAAAAAEEDETYEEVTPDDGDDDPLVTERLADAGDSLEDENGSPDDAPLSACWSASIATTEQAAVPPPVPPAGNVTTRSPRQVPPPQCRRRLEKEQLQLQALGRQLAQQKKLNAELQQQLHAFRKNEAVAQLENRNKERQLQIDQLQQENRLLVHQQRLLTKQVEELQDAKDNFPMTKRTLQEELRVCKESLRRCKEKLKDADEKASKTHQQAVDLVTKNKALLERVKRLEAPEPLSSPSGHFTSLPSSYATAGSSASVVDAESIIANQEDEITRLQQRVSLMKKTQRSERSKQDHRLESSQAEVKHAQQQLDTFHQQLFAKEKTIRGLFLQMKSLKRAVQDLANAQQTNHHMQQMAFGRDAHFLGQHSPLHRHNHRTSQQQLQQASPSRLYASASTSAPASTQALAVAAPRKETSDGVYRTLRQLGYVPSFMTQSPRKRFEHMSEHRDGDQQQLPIAAVDGKEDDDEEGDEEEELPPNCVQGRLVPGPPPSSAARRAIGSSGSGRALRADVYASGTPPTCRTSDATCVMSDTVSNEGTDDRASRVAGDVRTREDPMDSEGDDDGNCDRSGSASPDDDDEDALN